VRLLLGDAYDRAGRSGHARRALQAGLEQRMALNPPESQAVLAARERWGRFLLAQGDAAGAEKQFREVVARDGGRRLSHLALAHGGLAGVALARGDLATASAASETAVHLFETVQGFRDVRMGPYLWLIHAEVLRRGGQVAAARDWAARALDASRRYDDPGAPSIRTAQAALLAAGGPGAALASAPLQAR
jgi:serine/threonine-protein kinase